MSPASCAQKWIVLTGLLLSLPTMAGAQGSVGFVGGEDPVTGSLRGDQVKPSIAVGSNGGIVTWHDNATDPFGSGVSALWLDASLHPIGTPKRINATIIGDQENADVALLADGGAAIAWESGPVGHRHVMARFLKADGSFTTSKDIPVSSTTIARRSAARVAQPYYRNNKMLMRSQLVPLTVRNTVDFSASPHVAALSDGTVVVAYGSFRRLETNTIGVAERLSESRLRPGLILTNTIRQPYTALVRPMQDVYFQRFTSAGVKLGDETVANSERDYNQRDAKLAALPDGKFVLCWISENPPVALGHTNRTDDASPSGRRAGGRVDVHARIFAQDGSAITDTFRVNTADLPCGAPSVAAAADGSFTVTWAQRDVVRTNGLDVYARTFNAAAAPQSEPQRMNTTTYGDQFAPVIATVGAQQIVIWSSMGQDGSWEGVYGRALVSGAPAGDEFRVNTTTAMRQIHPAISAAGSQAAVVWSSYALDSGFDLFMQRLATP